MKQIESLSEDINKLLCTPHILSDLALEKFGADTHKVLKRQFLQEEREPYLRMSLLGSKCDRQLQYKMNPAFKAEALEANVRLKFMYGDLIEALVLLLAREAGHTVEGEQDELDIDGVIGHRDAIVDGVVCDVKSASTRSFDKFKNHLRLEDDVFGYIDQLGAYLYASQSDKRVYRKQLAGFLVVDKQFGHICVDLHTFDRNQDYRRIVHDKQRLVQSDVLAPRGYFDEADGASGNRKLSTGCSYCAYKRECWPGLQVYLYSNGPKFLTRVVKEPKVPKGAL